MPHASPSVSFEFFPPADDDARTKLGRVAERLAALDPAFMTVTYGAGGTTRDRTRDAVRDLAVRGYTVAGHLSCVASTPEIVHDVADDFVAAGVTHIVAVRGDEPEGNTHPPAYESAAELVAALRARPDGGSLEITVAAYPDVHPRAASAQTDLDALKAKVDAGADRAITQFFFDVDAYLRFRDRAAAAGIDVPIVPGIMPMYSVARITGFAARCGANIPAEVAEMFAGLDDTPEIRRMVAASIAAGQCRRLLDEGADHVHFYTLNQANMSLAICRTLGLTS